MNGVSRIQALFELCLGRGEEDGHLHPATHGGDLALMQLADSVGVHLPLHVQGKVAWATESVTEEAYVVLRHAQLDHEDVIEILGRHVDPDEVARRFFAWHLEDDPKTRWETYLVARGVFGDERPFTAAPGHERRRGRRRSAHAS